MSLHPSWESRLHATTLDSISRHKAAPHTEVIPLRDADEHSGRANKFD